MTPSRAVWTEHTASELAGRFGPTAHWSEDQGRACWRGNSDGPHWTRSLVLVDDGPVAAAGAWHPRLHPRAEWCYVEVRADRRRNGLGTQAFESLVDTLPTGTGPLRCKTAPGSAGEAWATAMGFSVVHRTRTLRVLPPEQPGELHVERWAGSLAPAELVDAFVRWYVAGHESWDPAGPVFASLASELFFGEGSTALSVTVGGSIVGVAVLLSAGGPITFVGGALAVPGADAVAVVTAMLRSAAGRSVDVEVDGWMTDVAAAVATMPHHVVSEGNVMVRA